MPQLQQVMVIGHLGRDTEVKTAKKTGNTFSTFSIASSWRDQDGEEVTTWYNVSAFGGNAKYAANYLRKGNLVFVHGNLQPRPYKRNDGSDAISMDVMADTVTGLGPRDESKETTSDWQDGKRRDQGRGTVQGGQDEGNGLIDDVPF